jgi:hypothetical protein
MEYLYTDENLIELLTVSNSKVSDYIVRKGLLIKRIGVGKDTDEWMADNLMYLARYSSLGDTDLQNLRQLRKMNLYKQFYNYEIYGINIIKWGLNCYNFLDKSDLSSVGNIEIIKLKWYVEDNGFMIDKVTMSNIYFCDTEPYKMSYYTLTKIDVDDINIIKEAIRIFNQETLNMSGIKPTQEMIEMSIHVNNIKALRWIISRGIIPTYDDLYKARCFKMNSIVELIESVLE